MRKFRTLPSLAILMAGMVLSWVVSNVVARATRERDEDRFHNEVQFAQERVQWHLEKCQQVLLGLRASMASSQDSQETIIASYTRHLSLRKTFPGVGGIGFARWMAPSESRSQPSPEASPGSTGDEPSLNLDPVTANPFRLIVTAFEPQDEQSAATVGQDLAADTSRMDAIMRARDSGLASAWGPIPWEQAPSQPPRDGFHLVLPLYRGGGVPNRLEERRTQFLGVVFARFIHEELFGNLVHDLASTAAVVELSDATKTDASLFFYAGPQGRARASSPRFSEVRHLSVADRIWSLRVTSSEDFDTKRDTWVPWFLYGAGIALTLFAYAVSRVQQRGRAQAEGREATLRELAARNEQLVEELTLESHQKDEEIRERKKTDQSLRDEMRTKEVLYSMARTLGSASGLEAVIEELTEKSRAFLDASFGAFLPHDPALRLAHATPVVGLDAEKLLDVLQGLLPLLDSSPASPPLHRRGTSEPETPSGPLGYEVLRDLSGVPATGPFSKALNDALAPLTTASLLRVPLVSCTGAPWGLLIFGHHTPGMFSDREGKLLASIASQASLALDNARLLQEALDAQRRAEEANRSKDDFLGVVSHELRTPLNAIQGWAQVLSRKESRTEEKVDRGIAVIRRNVDVQLRIIEDILDVARILNGKLHLEMHPTPMAAVVQSAVDSLRFVADSKGIHLKLEVQSDALVLGDGTRLQQVVWNLLSNAIKFSENGDTVIITLIESDQSLHLAVKDHGRGIEAGDLGVVFERFRQVDSSTTRAQGGLGLGLAIVRYLVEAHGGHVGVESAGRGQGCTFWVDIPRARLAPAEDGAPLRGPFADDGNVTATSQRVPVGSLKGLVILVVDDEVDATEWLAESLRSWGADVVGATSAKEGLRLIQTEHPNILISDLAMPEMDGFAFVREIRALATEDATIPAIALTAFARSEDARKAMMAGFQRHLSKPVNLDALVRSIAEVTASHQRRSTGSAA